MDNIEELYQAVERKREMDEEYCRILILDDEFIMRQGMKHMMDWEQEGFQIVGEGSTGEEGLVLAEELKPHIVLADIVMPVMDGIEFSAILGKKHPEIQLIILSSYDKFEYVKTTLLNGASDYILKPMLNPESLLETLKKAAGRIPGFRLKRKAGVSCAGQLERFLSGFANRLDETLFVSVFPHTLYRILAVNLRDCCDGHKDEYYSVRRRITDFFTERGVYSTADVLLEEEILCVILNYRLKDGMALVKDTDEIAEQMRKFYPRAFFVLSRSFSSIQKIRGFCKEDVMPNVEKGFYYRRKSLYIVEKYEGQQEVVRFEYETYTAYLAAKEYEKALDLFEDYTKYLCSRQMDEERLKNLTRNLLYNYLMETERTLGWNEGLRERYFREISDALWEEDYQNVMDGIFAGLRNILRDRQGAEENRIREIKNYVEGHYQEPLELSDIADKFGLSYSYLSTYFSQTAREGFSEFVNKIRIRHAKELLEEKGMSISKIGAEVGYTEHSYFCRVFKRMTAQTPSEYRRSRKGKQG